MSFLIKTNRFRLRELDVGDAEFAYLLNQDPEVIQYTGDEQFESIEAAEIFLRNYSDYQKYGYGRWAVQLKTTNELVGWCGLKFTKELNETDLGFRFFKKYWHNGYATESAMACLAYGFNELNLTTIVGRAMKMNVASIRVLEKCGMQYVGEFDFEKHPGELYRIDKIQFDELRQR